MALSKSAKIVGFVGVGILAVFILVVIYRQTGGRGLCEETGHLMHRDSEMCYLRDSPGPCNHNLIFLEEGKGSAYGACSCPYTRSNRSIIYHNPSQACYFIFTKAYCPEGHWLTIVKDGPDKGKPKCETNSCFHHQGSKKGAEGQGAVDDEEGSSGGGEEATGLVEVNGGDDDGGQWVPIKGGGCGELGAWAQGCPPSSIIRFLKGYILPSCFDPPAYIVTTGSIGVPASSCPFGSFPSIMGKCQPQFAFEFD